jgi:hypothetical protein
MLSLLRTHWVSMAVSMVLLGGATVLILLQPLLAGRLVDRALAAMARRVETLPAR